jgi:hypothetical protein
MISSSALATLYNCCNLCHPEWPEMAGCSGRLRPVEDALQPFHLLRCPLEKYCLRFRVSRGVQNDINFRGVKARENDLKAIDGRYS